MPRASTKFMRQSKIIKIGGIEVKVTGLPMDKNIELLSAMNKVDNIQALLTFIDFIELKKCCIPVVIKKKAEDFDGGSDYFIENELLNIDDISKIFETIFELSNGEEANKKRIEAQKKMQEGKDMITNG